MREKTELYVVNVMNGQCVDYKKKHCTRRKHLKWSLYLCPRKRQMNEDGGEPSADKGRCGQPVLSAFKSPGWVPWCQVSGGHTDLAVIPDGLRPAVSCRWNSVCDLEDSGRRRGTGGRETGLLKWPGGEGSGPGDQRGSWGFMQGGISRGSGLIP